MSVIYLIRHGQASFLKRDYDQLSEIGVKQSIILGEVLKQRKNVPAYVLGGSMKRHHETALHATEAVDLDIKYTEDGRWNEYDHMELITKHQPDFENFDELARYIKNQTHPTRTLQQLLNNSIKDWMNDRHDYILKWSDFKERVWSSVNELATRLEKEETAWVFTSGGPIAVVMLELLGLRDQQFMGLQGKIVNTGITKILVGKSGLSLSTYNEYSHLEFESSLITYR
ncbi:histidine phosphatase family protein [Aquimarina sp. AD10]|uniref:histidine phosphatase family protein n=1 Tax=Aquimarina sp. AD10 TaxID=1714849 RepID=UPI000E4F67E1|nr:histidine phosphatase family protein [Aquimarina sp. AD10]AXT62591.1 histidine phosphatase family protein [Aquimarina sp. AD10]RKM97775.1 histidine phosphatase family protein [Aquimarina sp. AD10]